MYYNTPKLTYFGHIKMLEMYIFFLLFIYSKFSGGRAVGPHLKRTGQNRTIYITYYMMKI